MSTATPPLSTTAPRWNLDTLFPGGSQSAEFETFKATLAQDIGRAEAEATNLPETLDGTALAAWTAWVLQLQDVAMHLSTAESFAGCLISADVKDERAHGWAAEIDLLQSRWQGLLTRLESLAISCSDADWQKLTGQQDLRAVTFALNEIRVQGREKMAPEKERLAQELAVNGYHAWNRLYDKMAGDLTVEFNTGEKTETISLGQLAMYLSNSRREIRKDALDKLETAWESQAHLAALALNYQAGFRLSLYGQRKWDHYLHEPLRKGRLEKATLDAMWGAVADAVPKLHPYIEAKKKLLGIREFNWYDQTAPVGSGEKTFSFAEAGTFIVDQLADFSSDMADFTRMALKENWIEAENRTGKAGGGFCTDFPTHKATRIFMTWGGEYDHLMTLAHELGHSYHAWVLKEAPFFAQHYPMNLAETASTFNELRVTDAALQATTDDRERLMLLDQKLGNAFTFFCNLRARYLFDCSFYEERAKGLVPRERLDELMVAAQRQAFGRILAEPGGFHPLFWASKLHFFITSYPFYNFPYTFGFLFANGVYDRAKQEGAAFASSYRNLLADTGTMSTEAVAQKHLGVDLTRRDFWDAATQRVLADVEPFVKLAGTH